MKALVSMLAIALALAFTGPVFAGNVTTAKNAADCAKAACGTPRRTSAQRKRCRPLSALSDVKGVGFGGRPSATFAGFGVPLTGQVTEGSF
jgi:hypothetical protein